MGVEVQSILRRGDLQRTRQRLSEKLHRSVQIS